MSEPLLNVMKVMLLAGLYLFFVRVLWSVFSELRDPRTIVRKQTAKNGRHAQRSAIPDHALQGQVPVAMAPAGAPPAPAPGSPSGRAPIVDLAIGQLLVIDPPELAGVRYQLGPEITLGRADTNAIMLDDTYVSTVHARIFETKGTYFVEDLASRNGSTLNGAPLVATTALMPGDRLQFGATAMEFS